MEQIYNAQYFIDKFEAIPEDKWITGSFDNGNGCRCASGWCRDIEPYGRDKKMRYCKLTLEAAVLNDLFEKGVKIKGIGENLQHEVPLFEINDGTGKRDYYSQPTPKQRILAALNDFKALGL